MPSNQPQNSNDKKTISVESPRPLPITLGSIIDPIITFTLTYTKVRIKALTLPNCKSVISIAGTAAIIEPIFGIKLNINANTAQRNA